MSSPVSFRLNLKEFNQAWRRKLEYSKGSLAYNVNKTLFFVARAACRDTPRADRLAIMAQYGVVEKREIGQKVRIFKRAGIRRGKMITQDVFAGQESGGEMAATILARWRIWHGRPLPRRVEKITGGGQPTMAMSQAVGKAMLGSMLSAVGDVASGWLPAIRSFYSALHGKEPTRTPAGVKQYGPDQGRGVPAQDGMQCKGTIENAVENRLAMNPDFLARYGGPALQKAFDDETGKILEYVRNKEIEEGRKIGMKIFG